MTDPIPQTVTGWDDWPRDVVVPLRDWNRRFLLSFRPGPDFDCSVCNRRIASHPNGNPVLRSHRKAKGRPVCEGCLVALARRYETPPGPARKPTREERFLGRIHALERRLDRLRGQLRHDQTYIDRLEAEIPPERLTAVKDDLYGHHRRVPAG